ncbi:HAMP domain-containing protein, partial [Rhodopseudomonas sp. B29]|uniref:HAMP domain-containing protein n=1 Tax=Rhodopseudomonas sp. B29 TaxID=95607 RepID=UPI0003B3A9C7
MRFTVKAKLAAGFGIVILLSAIAGGLAYIKLSDMAATTEVLSAAAGRLDKASQLKEMLLQQIRAEKNSILANSDSDVDRYVTEIGNIRTKLTQARDEVHASATESGKKILDKFSAAYLRVNSAQDQTLRLAKTDKAKAVESSTTEVRKAVGEATVSLDEYVTFVRKLMSDRSEQAKEDGARAQLMLISLVVASLIIAVIAAVWIAINISRALARAVDLADAVAIGDLSKKIEVSSNDEVGDLVKSLNAMTANLNATAAVANKIALGDLTVDAKRLSEKDTLGIALEQMIEKLRQIVSEALTAAQNVSAGSQELSASAEQLSQGATEQASSAEEASSSMEEMAANIKQNAENANQPEKIAAQSAKDA